MKILQLEGSHYDRNDFCVLLQPQAHKLKQESSFKTTLAGERFTISLKLHNIEFEGNIRESRQCRLSKELRISGRFSN
jgi:hypothetical protein